MRFFLLLTVLIVDLVVGFGGEVQAFKVMDAGAVSCGTWTSDRTSKSSLASVDVNWVLGFLSAIGYKGEGVTDPLEGMGPEGVAAWIDNYCREHPHRSHLGCR